MKHPMLEKWERHYGAAMNDERFSFDEWLIEQLEIAERREADHRAHAARMEAMAVEMATFAGELVLSDCRRFREQVERGALQANEQQV